MRYLSKLWRILFAVSILAIAVQQIIVSAFMPVILPPWPAQLAGSLVAVWLVSLLLALLSLGVMWDNKARAAAVYLGWLLLILALYHIPYQLQHYPAHLGSWTDPLKVLALCGCALIVASSLKQATAAKPVAEIILPLGPSFLAITMLLFGIAHFFYVDFVKLLVPAWLPGNVFWTYLAGVGLIGAGAGILLNIKRRLAANLLGIMILLWVILLHIPRAIADPHSGNGNEVVSVFEAIAFGSAALTLGRKR